MVKRVFLAIVLTVFVYGDFKQDCVACHQEKRVDLRKTFMKAILIYGGEENFKTALFYYCKNPVALNSVMDEDFIKKYLPLKPVNMSDEKLKRLLKVYWDRYKIIGRLK